MNIDQRAIRLERFVKRLGGIKAFALWLQRRGLELKTPKQFSSDAGKRV